MIETITPAVCGGRNRYRFALTTFTIGAIGAAAVVGALLGLLGGAVGARHAIVAFAALAAVAAAREAGLIRLPLPQLRLQVPQRWHDELPLPVWATGYGAGLGAGLFTFQPVATFWIACAAALALGRPLAAAACFSLYGLGRSAMVILPRREPDATAAVEQIARYRPALKRANAAALLVCAALLAAAPASAEPLPLGTGDQLDPSISWGVLAYTQRPAGVSSVVVRVSETETYTYADARLPSIDGRLLAYADAAGVRVVEWRTGVERARIPGTVSRPALDWPWLAYREDYPEGGKAIRLRNLDTGETRSLALTGPSWRGDLGRPTIAAGRVAWHLVYPGGSRIVLYRVAEATRTLVVRSRIALFSHPALTSARIAWVEQRNGSTRLRRRLISGSVVYTLAEIRGRSPSMWTTALGGRTAYYTRWALSTGAARIHSVTR